VRIADNIDEVRKRITAAAQRAKRPVNDVTLMAVSKTFPADAIREAYAAGQRIFGENRVQEFAEKAEALQDLKDAEFHLIGHLQSNKAVKAAELFHAVDSVDSLKLAQRLNEAAKKIDTLRLKPQGVGLKVLIEINIGNEEQKAGLLPDSAELEAILAATPQFSHLEIEGLMAIPPHTEDPESARPYFMKMRELRERIAERNLPAVSMKTLSMGMSHDFEVAIEEGSTCVRLGTAIFGLRDKH
jgi:PLP dependent protein